MNSLNFHRLTSVLESSSETVPGVQIAGKSLWHRTEHSVLFNKYQPTFEWESDQVSPCIFSLQSKASDMRFDGIFEEKEIIQESKRQRVINSRYRGDYIEPVIYRAIME